jgi:hypothetical protein
MTVCKVLMRSVMTYSYSAMEFVPDTHLLKLQLLQNRLPHSFGYFDRCTLEQNHHDRKVHLIA